MGPAIASGFTSPTAPECGRPSPSSLSILERVATDCARLLGDEHPNTVAVVAALRAWQADT